MGTAQGCADLMAKYASRSSGQLHLGEKRMSSKPASSAPVSAAPALSGCAGIAGRPVHPLARRACDLREIRTANCRRVILTGEQSRSHALKSKRGKALLLKLDCNRGK